MMMSGGLFGVKYKAICRADRQGSVEHDHPDGERRNPAFHG
jgi:hypothetical protein